MRQIKFRGKRFDNREWEYGDLSQWSNGRIDISIPTDNTKEKEGVKVIASTVGQFTGLFDKNGREIYEGDLLRYPPEDKWDEKNFVAHEVFFHDNDCCDMHIGWQMNRRHFQGHICGTSENPQMKPSTTAQMEVIGNIHDNPELLKGGEK